MSTGKRDWQNPPAPANRELVVSAACNGLLIGKCLQEALNSLNDGDDDNNINAKKTFQGDDADGEVDEPHSKIARVTIGKNAKGRILRAFGEAVADTRWKSSSSSPSHPSASTDSSSSCPPAALLRGRLDHYNRVGKNWRIVADDLQLKERIPLERNRRKRDRQPLWSVTNDKQREIPISGTMHIHAYDDV